MVHPYVNTAYTIFSVKLCLNGTLASVDFMEVILGDIPVYFDYTWATPAHVCPDRLTPARVCTVGGCTRTCAQWSLTWPGNPTTVSA